MCIFGLYRFGKKGSNLCYFRAGQQAARGVLAGYQALVTPVVDGVLTLDGTGLNSPSLPPHSPLPLNSEPNVLDESQGLLQEGALSRYSGPPTPARPPAHTLHHHLRLCSHLCDSVGVGVASSLSITHPAFKVALGKAPPLLAPLSLSPSVVAV